MAYPETRASKRKLRISMATATSRSEGKLRVHTNQCMADRFSDLPEGVAHLILSSFSIADLTRFGSVSKRCRELYLSTPTLNFDDSNAGTCDKWLRMSESLYRFLNFRWNNKIQNFRIRQWSHPSVGCVCDDGKSQTLMWIKMALRFNIVEVLDLELGSPNGRTTFEFPSFIFDCASLRSLSVSMCNTIMKAPSSACSSNLECLILNSVTIDEGFFKWISTSCKRIKELRLEYLGGKVQVITIESSSLESLSILSNPRDLYHYDLKITGEKLQDIRIHYGYGCERSPRGKLNIFAPNLKCLVWFGDPANEQQLGELLCLVKAEICLSFGGKENFDKVLEVLRSIRRVKALILHKPTIKALHYGGLFMPESFEDVSHLEININSFTDYIVPAMVSLCRGMPNLTTLYLKSNPKAKGYPAKPDAECSGVDTGYWKLQYLPFLSELKEVKVELSSKISLANGSNIVEFSRFLLEQAHNLKKMVIVHSHPLRLWALKKLRASETFSNATVVYHKK